MKRSHLLSGAAFRLRISSIILVLLIFSNFSIAQEGEKPSEWLNSRAAGLRDAQLKKRPILIRFSAEWCHWCKRLDEEIEKPSVQTALKNWTLVELDFDRLPEDARALGVDSIPALRVVAPSGRLLESHDGYMSENKLIDWLTKAYDKATEGPEETLFGAEAPTPIELRKMIRLFSDRDAALREAAIRRLIPFPSESAETIVNSLKQENLSVRLASLELLREWKAPVEDIDPWQPETVTGERIGRMEEWVAVLTTSEKTPRVLSAEELAEARADLDRLLTADPVTALAIRERLARYNTALLSEVVQRLNQTSTDEDRSRLLALRYRLVMPGQLALTSPGLVDRLAAIDVRTRHQAVRELSDQATPDCLPLFLELFADPDPFVRELSLFGLRVSGGEEGQNSLVKLLDDPDPNVRAAVLKLFAEEPPAELQSRLVEYMKTEQDTGLLVHAARCFRKLKSREPDNLVQLLKHRDWQVRAEILDTLTGSWQRYPEAETKRMMQNEDICDAVAECLNDDDPFVVSRAIKGLSDHLSKPIIESMIAIPKKHPSMMNDVVDALDNAHQFEKTVLPSLKEFFKSEDVTTRAAAIRGLFQLNAEESHSELTAAFQDPHIEVRIAAANAFTSFLNRQQRVNQTSGILNRRFTRRNSTRASSTFIINQGRDSSIVADPDSEDESDPSDEMPIKTKEAADDTGDEEMPVADDAEKVIQPDDDATDDAEAKPLENVPQQNVPAQGGVGSGFFGLIQNLFGGSDSTNTPQALSTNDDEQQDSAEEGSKRDQWLKDFHVGKNREEWLEAMIPLLEKMFTSNDTSERIASAVPLVAVGRFDLVGPEVTNLVRNGGKNAEDMIAILAWLPIEERLQIANQLIALPMANNLIGRMLQIFTQYGDVRDADFLWNLPEAKNLSRAHLSEIYDCLKQIYFGSNIYSLHNEDPAIAKQMKLVYSIAKQQLQQPHGWRHVVALALMIEVRPKDNDESTTQLIRQAAVSLIDDTNLDADLRAEARQLSVAVLDSNARRETLIEWIKSDDRELRVMALHTLLGLDQGLSVLKKSAISIQIDQESDRIVFRQGEPIEIEPPKGLTVEVVRPLLSGDDDESRALAGYVVAVSGDPSGVQPLLVYWQSKERDDHSWSRLVYRAISAIDDSSYLPVLIQIYKGLNQWEINDFYWTIRNMEGPKILEFRKRIRNENGEHLR